MAIEQEAWKALWSRMTPGQQAAYEGEREALMRGGMRGKEAVAKLRGPGGPYTAAVLFPGGGEVVHKGYTVLKESEDRKAEMERQEGFKRGLAREAGSNKDQREWAEWASRWLSLVRREDGVHRWDEVAGEGSVAPHQGAVALLEQWCKNPEKFSEQLGKLLGKQSDLSDDLVRRERKRESELVRLLQEVDAEIEARGDEAYA
jgi:hypothetical protein